MQRLAVGDKVMLKDGYFGYFSDRSSEVLTVAKVISSWEWHGVATSEDFIQLEEIDEQHGISSYNLIKIGNVNN